MPHHRISLGCDCGASTRFGSSDGMGSISGRDRAQANVIVPLNSIASSPRLSPTSTSTWPTTTRERHRRRGDPGIDRDRSAIPVRRSARVTTSNSGTTRRTESIRELPRPVEMGRIIGEGTGEFEMESDGVNVKSIRMKVRRGEIDACVSLELSRSSPT